MEKVQIGELRNHVSRYVKRAEQGETIVIINRAREVAVLKPRHTRRRASKGLFGCMKGSARVVGDIVSPIIPEEEWFRD